MEDNTGNSIQWPPPHRFRRSKKARHINLRFIPGEGVEIVLPEKPVFASEQMGLNALERHREWVLRQVRRQAQSAGRDGAGGKPPKLNGFQGDGPGTELPEEFALHGGAIDVRLEWAHRELRLPMPGPESDPATKPPGGAPVLDLSGLPGTAGSPLGQSHALLCRLKDGTEAERRKRLFLWLRRYAGAYLSGRLLHLSRRHGIPYASLSIGWQKSRWGSYSCKGEIRLNAKLIFLPRELSDLVILHELCHATEMSHNQRFWQNLEKLEPRARELDRRLNRAASALPAWVRKGPRHD